MQSEKSQTWLSAAFLQTASYLLLAASVAVLLVFVLLGQYAHPSSDDFCMAAGVNEYGLWVQLWQHYLEWSGRYSSNALYAIYPIAFGLFDGYKFIPAITIAALILATAFFLSSLFATRLFARAVLLASTVFVSVYLLGMMSPASGLFWMAGASTYQTANVLFLVALGLLIRLADRQERSENPFPVLVIALAVMVIAVGANETSMLALSAVAAIGVILQLRKGWVRLWPWLTLLLVSLICFAIVYLSPGNEIRAADFPLRHDFARSIKGSLSVGFKVLWIWISNPVFILATLLTPVAVSRLLQASKRSFRVSAGFIVAMGLCTLVLPIALQFPAWWGMGGWPPARTVDAIYFLFLVCWFGTVAALGIRYLRADASKSAQKPYPAPVLLVLSVLFAIAVVQHSAFRQAKADWLQHARPYHDYLNARYQIIEQAVAEGQGYLIVPDYELQPPRTLYFNDIMKNPEHWRNVCYADYFGLQTIRRIKTRRVPEQAPVDRDHEFLKNITETN